MKPWKDLFRTHILERGLNYYEKVMLLHWNRLRQDIQQ